MCSQVTLGWMLHCASTRGSHLSWTSISPLLVPICRSPVFSQLFPTSCLSFSPARCQTFVILSVKSFYRTAPHSFHWCCYIWSIIVCLGRNMHVMNVEYGPKALSSISQPVPEATGGAIHTARATSLKMNICFWTDNHILLV